MTWAGAKGETAAQMKKVLHLDGDRALEVAGSLVAGYGAPDQKATVRVANRLFGEKTYAFEQPYLSRVKSAFGASLEPLDFKTAAEDSRSRINGWVAKETHDRIKDLVPPRGVDGETRLVLTNAIYFLGDWASPFMKERTGPAAFFSSAADSRPVPTMHQTEHFGFVAIDGVKLLQMPYENSTLAMTLVLPDAVDGLDAMEGRLTPAVLDRWLGALSNTNVIVSLPSSPSTPPPPSRWATCWCRWGCRSPSIATTRTSPASPTRRGRRIGSTSPRCSTRRS